MVNVNEVITKHPDNPVLKASDLPYESSLVFNAGVCKYEGKYVMVFRNDYGFSPDMQKAGQPAPEHGTNIGLATSDDGLNWTPRKEPWFQLQTDEIKRAYDPRLTVIDGRVYMCFAVDTHHGVRGGVMVTEDFEDFEILSLSAPDNRNMVLFPEKIDGKYARLERPFPVYSRKDNELFDIWFSASPDLRYWGDTDLVLGLEDVPYCNCKIGPGAPPVKTSKGWLTTIHAVCKDEQRSLETWDKNGWSKEYFGGLILLDLQDPTKVIGMCPEPILRAEHDYELDGFRGSVIFPGGMILEDSGEVKIYYGAADTVEALATAQVDDLVELCQPLIAQRSC